MTDSAETKFTPGPRERVILENTGLFLEEVSREVGRARTKFPSSNLVLAALMEEVGELAQAMLKWRAGKEPIEHIYEEAVQVAAVACRVATEGDPSFDIGYVEP